MIRLFRKRHTIALLVMTAAIMTTTTDATAQKGRWCRVHQAAFDGKIDTIRNLIAKKVDIHHTDENGITLLHMAARGGRPDVAKVLLDLRAEVNALDRDGATPLDEAYRIYVSHRFKGASVEPRYVKAMKILQCAGGKFIATHRKAAIEGRSLLKAMSSVGCSE